MTNIPFRIKRLTDDAKIPTRENKGDLFDLYANYFSGEFLKDVDLDGCLKRRVFRDNRPETESIVYHDISFTNNNVLLYPQGRILIKTGIAIELPQNYGHGWKFEEDWIKYPENEKPEQYAVADVRPRSGLALKYGLTVLNTPGTIDNSYRKEIGVIMVNHGHESCAINKGDKIAQMLIRPLYNSEMQVVEDVKDTGRGGFGSTGK
jgi:dUTP pyrophosphatase